MADYDTRCGWKIRWTFGQDARCDKPIHLASVAILPAPEGRYRSEVDGDPEHSSKLPNGVTRLTWQAGDRREFVGEYPGPCTKLAGCTLHTGHHGRCAP